MSNNANPESYMIVFRFAPPSKFDQFPKGTRCRVISSVRKSTDVYIQISKNEDDPIWEYSDSESLKNS